MAEYIPTPVDWVRKQVELYESSGGTEGTTLLETGLPCILFTHTGNKTGAVRKTPLMRVKDGDDYILVGSMGGAPKNPVWVYNIRENPNIELRDATEVGNYTVSELPRGADRDRIWELCVEAFPPYADYKAKTERLIPVFVATPA